MSDSKNMNKPKCFGDYTNDEICFNCEFKEDCLRIEAKRVSEELTRLTENPTKEEIEEREQFVRSMRPKPKDLLREFTI